MLEGLVAWVLNNYVGEYFENLNTDQLSIALLQGQVELENVPLKKTALRKFDIPVQVKSGIIGRLTLTIPIHIRSEPWVLKMRDVLLLLGPSTSKYDVEFVEQYEQSRIQSALNDLENYHKKQLLIALGVDIIDDSALSQNQRWGASLVAAITNNMLVILDNVHIRYEDVFRVEGVPNSERFFNFGIRIENTTIQKTNAQWKPTFVQPSSDSQSNTFKKLDIKRLSVYWNFVTESNEKNNLSINELKEQIASENTRGDAFILQPFCMEARMEKNSSKFPLKSIPLIPRFKFDLRPEKIEIDFSKSQLAQIRYLAREWARFDRARQHRKWRPVCSILKSPKLWWNFVTKRVIDINNKQRGSQSKALLLRRVYYFNSYCKAYRKHLDALLNEATTKLSKNENIYVSTKSQENIIFMKQVEHDAQFSYDELYLFRETVYKKFLYEIEKSNDSGDKPEIFEIIESSNQKDNQRKNCDKENVLGQSSDETRLQNEGWYGWLSSWFSNQKDLDKNQIEDDINEAFFLDLSPEIEEKEKNLTPELRRIEKQMKDEILDVLNETWDDSTILRRDTLLAEIVFRLDKMVIRFLDSEDNDELSFLTCNRILSLDMRRVTSRIHLSPREHRTEVSLSVEDMSIQRLQTLPTELVTPIYSNYTFSDELSLFSPICPEFGSETFDSLLYGEANLNTQLLFTIGRAEKKIFDDNAKNNKCSQNISNDFKKQNPMLKLFYKRLAPKLDVYHEINIQLAPIFSMYEEDALNGLFNIFSADNISNNNTYSDINTNTELIKNESIVNTRLFFTLSVPEISIELRRRNLTILNNNNNETKKPNNSFDNFNSQSFPFVVIDLKGLKFSLINSELYVSKMKLLFLSIVINDFFEPNCEKKLLLKSVSSLRFYNDKKSKYKINRSSFCLNSNSTDQTSKHLLTKDFFSTSLPDRLNNFFTMEHSTTDCLVENENLNDQDSFFNFLPKTNFSFLLEENSYKTVNFTFVDHRHPNFLSEYEKQNCLIDANLKNDLEVGMNRRTWVTLLDFFGLLGNGRQEEEKEENRRQKNKIINELNNHSSNTENENYSTKIIQNNVSYNVRFQIRVDEAKISMNYPKNNTQLGVCILNSFNFNVKLDLNNSEEPMRIQLSALDFVLTDSTPFYSQLYNERLIIKQDKNVTKNTTTNGIVFEIIKFILKIIIFNL